MAKIFNLTPDAVRRGTTYCSPGCGRGCKYAENQKAVANAKRLCDRIGGGYTGEVHDNLGWHVRAVSPCTRVKVYEHVYKRKRSWHALLSEPGGIGGKWSGRSDVSPHDAINEAIDKAQVEFVLIRSILTDLMVLVRRRPNGRKRISKRVSISQ